jgi:excisionase family DNA binding protein
MIEGRPTPAASTTEPRDPTPATLPEPEFLTKRQVAALMQVSVRTLDRLVAHGDVPHVRLSRRCVRFPVKALRDWMGSRTQFRK